MTIELLIPEQTETPSKTVPDLLRHAALIIEERGWTQDTYEDRNGSVCFLGALGIAYAGRSDFDSDIGGAKAAPDFYGASTFFERFVGTWYVAAWNDEPGRTADEVTAALRAAALHSKKEGPA